MRNYNVLILDEVDGTPNISDMSRRWSRDAHNALYFADFAFMVNKDGSVEVIKSRYGLPDAVSRFANEMVSVLTQDKL